MLLVLLGTYLFVYPWSILLVSLDRVPVWGTWMGGALLIIQGTLMGLWLIANHGRNGLAASGIILLFSWFIEHVGTTTGFPFGAYRYTDVLLPKIAGVVPLAIPFAWLLVVPAALGITERLLTNRDPDFFVPLHEQPFRMVPRVLGAASFAVLLDITIEPVSVHVNGYWEWYHGSGGYYGVPVSNFAAWWVTSVLLVWVLVSLQRPVDDAVIRSFGRSFEGYRFNPRPSTLQYLFPWLPSLLYMLNLTMFVLVNIAHAQLGAAMIGSLILCYLTFVWLKPTGIRRLLNAGRSRRRQRET